jgi:hypothetical protein
MAKSLSQLEKRSGIKKKREAKSIMATYLAPAMRGDKNKM